jgi:hypothetical protein
VLQHGAFLKKKSLNSNKNQGSSITNIGANIKICEHCSNNSIVNKLEGNSEVCLILLCSIFQYFLCDIQGCLPHPHAIAFQAAKYGIFSCLELDSAISCP